LRREIKLRDHYLPQEEAMNRQSSGSKVRYTVVGLGHIAQVAILPGFKSARNSELVALVSGDPRKRTALARKYRVTEVFSYEAYDQVLPLVDAVYLGLPNHLHKEYAVQAAEAGVHVLCEKPMAVTEEECETMIAAADRNRTKLMVAYRLHFEKGNLQAIRTIRSGRLGKPRIFSSDFAQQVKANNVRVTEPVSRGGGPVYDMGVYCINAARYLFGAAPTKVLAVRASNGDRRFQKVDEMMSAVLYFPDERLASFTCSFGAADISRYTIVGTRGVLTSDPAYEYAKDIEHEVIVGGKKSKRTLPSGISLPPRSAISRIVFSRTERRNLRDLKGWQTFGSYARSMNQFAREQRSRCRRFLARKSQARCRRFVGPLTASPKPSIPNLPHVTLREE
jgi:predicted dehydrogenase